MDSKRSTASSDTHKFLLAIVLCGIILRFVQQFIYPVFNVDEVELGRNITDRNFAQLLFPLQSYQSCPPLYLLLQKTIITIFPVPVWVGLKLFSFLISIVTSLLFYRIVVRNYTFLVAVMLMVMFTFNPFIAYNMLTLKQYSIDLFGILLLVNFYRNLSFQKHIALFFMVWCLFSNAGLFGCAGYLLYLFTLEKDRFRISVLWHFIRKNILTFLAPLPYLIYFHWFMQQEGALELKAFMQEYWATSFIPLNAGIFKYTFYLIHSFCVFLLDAVLPVGALLLGIFVYGCYCYLTKKAEIKKGISLLLFIIAIHLVLNLIHLYPISDRLFLYMAPFFLFVLGLGLQEIIGFKFGKIILSLLILATITSYAFYSVERDNNVVSVYRNLTKIEGLHSIYASEKAIFKISAFDDLTENYFAPKQPLQLIPIDAKLDKADYLVTRITHKFGPDKISDEVPEITKLIHEKKIILHFKTDGYNIYKVNK
ncbi:MAG TPA: hypothetical protein VK528_08690 [Flavobacterium sp.]|nr:hypothetical protein [Flavobacterium sp.]